MPARLTYQEAYDFFKNTLRYTHDQAHKLAKAAEGKKSDNEIANLADQHRHLEFIRWLYDQGRLES